MTTRSIFSGLTGWEDIEVDNVKPQEIVSSLPVVTGRSCLLQAYKDDVYLGPKDFDESLNGWEDIEVDNVKPQEIVSSLPLVTA